MHYYIQKAEAEVKAKRKELEEAQKTDADNLGKVEDFTRKTYPDWDGEPRRSEKDISELSSEAWCGVV